MKKNFWQNVGTVDVSELDVDYHTVKITGCSRRNYWYKHLIGETVKVYELMDEDGDPTGEKFYALNDQEEYEGKMLDKKDCEVL